MVDVMDRPDDDAAGDPAVAVPQGQETETEPQADNQPQEVPNANPNSVDELNRRSREEYEAQKAQPGGAAREARPEDVPGGPVNA